MGPAPLDMNKKIRASLGAFIALSIAGLIILVFVHYRTKNSFQVSFTEDKKVEVKIDNIHYSGTKEGRIEWELDAESASRSKDEDLTLLTTVRVVYYPKKGAPYTMTAEQGKFREAAGEVEAEGSVRIETKDGYTLVTDSVKYSTKSKEITSADRVELTSEKVDLSGQGLVVELDKGRIQLFNNVKAVFRDGI